MKGIMKESVNKIISGIHKNCTTEQIERHLKIGARLNLKAINADHYLELKDMHKAYDLCKDFAETELSLYSNFENDNILKYFTGMQKWRMLSEVISASSKGEIVYKECLSKKLKCSHKTLTKYIDECIEAGYFVYLDPITGGCKDKRIINIRPSEDTIVAFINWNVSNILSTLDFVKKHCKINLTFNAA